MKYKGVIFDMDGVLADSEPVILAAATAALKEYGVDCVPEDFIPFVGAGEDRYIGGVAEKYGLTFLPEMKARTYDIYDVIVSEKLHRFDGAATCLEELKRRGARLALASAADRRKVCSTLAAAGIEQSLFEVVLTGEDVTRKKPSPDIYILAGQRLGLAPAECVVIEDAINGVKSAVAAQMSAVGVATSFSPEQLIAAGAGSVVEHIGRLASYLNALE